MEIELLFKGVNLSENEVKTIKDFFVAFFDTDLNVSMELQRGGFLKVSLTNR